MTGYYDMVLGLIPLALAGITGSLTVAGLQFTTALPLASLVAVGLVGHAMFVRPPVDAPVRSVAEAPTRASDGPTFNAAD